MPKENTQLEEIALTVKKTVERIIKDRGNLEFSPKPTIEKRQLVEYDGQMRVIGMDAFNEPTYISLTSFYPSEKDRDDRKDCGAFVMYVERSSAEIFFKGVGFRKIEEDNLELMLETSGEFCQILVDDLTKDFSSLGYSELVSSPIENYNSSVPMGIDFSDDQWEKAEISFFIKDVKVLVLDLTMRPAK